MKFEGTRSTEISISIPWGTIFRIFSAILLAIVAIKLWNLAQILFVALLIAITLQPILDWTQRRHWPRWVGILACTLLVVGFIGALIGILVPAVTNEGGKLIERLPEFREDALKHLEKGPLHTTAQHLLSGPSFNDPKAMTEKLVAWTRVAVEAFAAFTIMLVVAIYFLVDGKRVYEWLLAFLPPHHRKKAAIASPEIAEVVGHYMVGQLITSTLCGAYALGVLLLFKVPNAAILAVLAAIFDLLPLIGFFLFTIPAVVMAFTVSPAAAAFVGLLYGAYHLVENYFIVPKVYGNRLRLSTLTVLVSCLAGGLVSGVIGVIAILPIVASYPIIERIWLRPFLERDTVERHTEIDQEAEKS